MPWLCRPSWLDFLLCRFAIAAFLFNHCLHCQKLSRAPPRCRMHLLRGIRLVFMLMLDDSPLRSFCCDPVRINSVLSLFIFGLLLSIHVLIVPVASASCQMEVCSSFDAFIDVDHLLHVIPFRKCKNSSVNVPTTR